MEKRKLVALIGKLYKGSKQAQSTVVSDGASQKNCGTSITKFSGLRKMKADVLNSGRFPHYSGHFSPPKNRPKWVHFCRCLPHFAKKTLFPGIKKAGWEPTLSDQMMPTLHFLSSEGRLLPLIPHILTPNSSKHAKITTQASYQNLGGYMCLHQYNDTSYD